MEHGEVNSADPETLAGFLDRSLKRAENTTELQDLRWGAADSKRDASVCLSCCLPDTFAWILETS